MRTWNIYLAYVGVMLIACLLVMTIIVFSGDDNPAVVGETGQLFDPTGSSGESSGQDDLHNGIPLDDYKAPSGAIGREVPALEELTDPTPGDPAKLSDVMYTMCIFGIVLISLLLICANVVSVAFRWYRNSISWQHFDSEAGAPPLLEDQQLKLDRRRNDTAALIEGFPATADMAMRLDFATLTALPEGEKRDVQGVMRELDRRMRIFERAYSELPDRQAGPLDSATEIKLTELHEGAKLTAEAWRGLCVDLDACEPGRLYSRVQQLEGALLLALRTTSSSSKETDQLLREVKRFLGELSPDRSTSLARLKDYTALEKKVNAILAPSTTLTRKFNQLYE